MLACLRPQSTGLLVLKATNLESTFRKQNAYPGLLQSAGDDDAIKLGCWICRGPVDIYHEAHCKIECAVQAASLVRAVHDPRA